MLSVHFTIKCKTKQQRVNLFMTYQHVITRHHLWVGRSLAREALVKPARRAHDERSTTLASSCKRGITLLVDDVKIYLEQTTGDTNSYKELLMRLLNGIMKGNCSYLQGVIRTSLGGIPLSVCPVPSPKSVLKQHIVSNVLDRTSWIQLKHLVV